jgi:environmental stress-induced protein Ves
MRIIRASEYRRMPWKNGGGETVEVAVSPAGAALDAFEWRVSMAHVATSGPFSRFPGVDRTLAVLAGNGVRLRVGGRAAVALGRDAPPFAFSGDDLAEVELIDGAIDDINVMTRRASHRHRLGRSTATSSTSLRREGDLLLVLARGAGARARTGRWEYELAAGDTILMDRTDGPRVEIAPTAAMELYRMDLWRL